MKARMVSNIIYNWRTSHSRIAQNKRCQSSYSILIDAIELVRLVRLVK